MQTIINLRLTAALGIFACLSALTAPELQAAPRSFAARRHLDVLADRLFKDANEVCWEMYRHYDHNRGFRDTYREMYRVLKDAEHIHDLVHEAAHNGRHDEDHIASDLHEIDKLFHHIEDDIRNWSSSDRGHRDFGHDVHGSEYGHGLTRKMRFVEQTLHHLMSDYGVKTKLAPPAREATPPAPGPPTLKVPRP